MKTISSDTFSSTSLQAKLGTKKPETAAVITVSRSIINMETTDHVNLIDDDDEKDPLALDVNTMPARLQQQTEQQELHQELNNTTSPCTKHTHSLRRHVPRIIVKALPPEKKSTEMDPSTISGFPIISQSTANTVVESSPSPVRGITSRRIQQQQQAKAAAAAAAAAIVSPSTFASNTQITKKVITQTSTMREVLASIPGFSVKPRRRSNKKLTTAAQIEQTKDGKIDLETPDSILASTNLRALLNKQTFSLLPPLYQYNLIQLLPSVDREASEVVESPEMLVGEQPSTSSGSGGDTSATIRLSGSCLNNEFFARACLEWRERLSEGEFTPEHQMKLRTEAEREKNKLDPWKLKHFEPYWDKHVGIGCERLTTSMENKQQPVNPLVKHQETCDNETELKYELGTKCIPITMDSTQSTTIRRNSVTFSTDQRHILKRRLSSPLSNKHNDTKISNLVSSIDPIDGNECYDVDNNVPTKSRETKQKKITPESVPKVLENLALSEATDGVVDYESSEFQAADVDGTTAVQQTHQQSRINSTCDKIEFPKCASSIAKILTSNTTSTTTAVLQKVEHVSNNFNDHFLLNSAEIKVKNMVSLLRVNTHDIVLDHTVDHGQSVTNIDDCEKTHNQPIEPFTTCSSLETITSTSTMPCSKRAALPKPAATSDDTLGDVQSMLTTLQHQQHTEAEQTIDVPLELNSNEMFQHVQHDWNFGGIKYLAPTGASTSAAITEDYVEQHQDMHTEIISTENIDLMEVVQQDDDIMDDVVECDDDVVECIGNEVRDHNEPTQEQLLDGHVMHDKIDNANVRNIVDKLQQHQQQQLQAQLQDVVHLAQNSFMQQPQNEYAHEVPIDILCDVPMSAADMEVSSSVVTNSSNSNDSSNNLSICSSSSNLTSIATTLSQIQQLSNQTQQQPVHQSHQQQQRQILVDSNGQIIGNLLIQQQQRQLQQQQLLQQLSLQTAAQSHQHQASTSSEMPKTQATMRKPLETNSNRTHQFMTSSLLVQQEQLEQQQQMQQRLSGRIGATTEEDETSLDKDCHTSTTWTNNQAQILQRQLLASTNMHQQPIANYQQQQSSSTTSHARFIPKALNIISMAPSGNTCTTATISDTSMAATNTTTNLATIPSVVSTYSLDPNVSVASTADTDFSGGDSFGIINANSQQAAATAMLNNHNSSMQVTASVISACGVGTMKTLTSSGVPTTIAQQRLQSKISTGKGRKVTTNRLPPGAVNLERSYQICQAVIQNSPNRENLKGQLRPPAAILSQQQTDATTTASTPVSSSNTNFTMAVTPNVTASTANVITSQTLVRQEELLTGAALPPNVMGVGRPGVYKVIGPRMGFPRKKYVERKTLPTFIRPLFSGVSGATSTATPTQLPTTSVTHEQMLHHNGSGQYVLLHRANVGATDNHAPRASSAPPIHQNQYPAVQNQLQSVNGLAVGGHGRPASVDTTTITPAISYAITEATKHQELHDSIGNVNAVANIVRRNIAAGANITYIDGRNVTASLMDTSNNFIVTTTAPSTNLHGPQLPQTQQPPHSHPIQISQNSGENTPPTQEAVPNNCACALNAMVICQQCGAFCHDDCISAAKLCLSCVIR
ncbi:polycomb protein Asx isoform X2 [Scaptodrosophila lebanonensis]|uniref:Polycomb protein Asx isoform X2 n=1 Tax=Drosophila lebanonensis TaxID=7225 RepID=A0A6J2TY23_DROLE|nr:polycomb protein Asx isoform X2 [Scaptodrosophila lebanonensis]